MPCTPDTAACNVQDQQSRPDSVLNFWKRLIKFRKANPTLVSSFRFSTVLVTLGLMECNEFQVYGDFNDIPQSNCVNEKVFVYQRRLDEKALFVAVNFSPQTVTYQTDTVLLGDLILGSYGDRNETTTVLRPFEAVLFQVL